MRLIDADALKKAIADAFYNLHEIAYIADIIERQPTIEPEVRLGRWIAVTNGRGGHECNQCHNYAPSYQTGKEHLSDYCPNCGARMDGGAENASA